MRSAPRRAEADGGENDEDLCWAVVQTRYGGYVPVRDSWVVQRGERVMGSRLSRHEADVLSLQLSQASEVLES